MDVGLSAATCDSAASAVTLSLAMRSAIECSSDRLGLCSMSLPKKAACATPACLAARRASARFLSNAMRERMDKEPALESCCLRAR